MSAGLAAWLLVVLAVGASMASAGGGNSAKAQMCQKGGWRSLVTSTGATFKNAGACVSHGAKGGDLGPKPSIVISRDIYACSLPVGCWGLMSFSGLQPGTQAVAHSPGLNVFFPVPASGAFSGVKLGFICGRAWNNAFAVGTTWYGGTIESAHVDSPCG
jgi:hypothetical protein